MRKVFVLTLLIALCLSTFSFVSPISKVQAQGPGEGLIAFLTDRDGNPEIYVMNADGSGVTRLTNNAAYDAGPAWSPDGSQIVFASDREGNFEIYVMNADGSGVTRLTNNPAYDDGPAWSPDGSQIVFASNRDGNFEIYMMNADGSGVTRLTNSLGDDEASDWSPDGTKILFRSVRDGNAEVYVMNTDGSGQTNLTNDPAADSGPTWSPDGTQIAFMSQRDGSGDAYVMNTDGSGVIRLTNNLAVQHHLDWSISGSRIVFSNSVVDNEVYVMNADGSGVTNLTNNPAADWNPAWQPASGCYIDGPAEVFEGDTIPITLRCKALAEEAFGFQLGHNATGAVTPQSTSYAPESFVTDAGPDILEVQNALDLYVVSRRAPAPAVSGSFSLASVDYTANLGQLTDGVATFTLTPFILGDIYGNSIDALAPMSHATVTIRDRYTVLGTVESEIAVNEINNVTVDLGPENFSATNVIGNSVAFDFTDKFDTGVLDLFVDTDAHLECGQQITLTQSITDLGTIMLLAGDVTDDGDPVTPATIDILDSTAIGLSFGSANLPEDINVDGVVNVLDLISVGRNYNAVAGECLAP